jgi:hypothetical protein
VWKNSGWVDHTAGPNGQTGERLVAWRDGLKVGGVSARGELEVRFGEDRNDLVPPTLTSLRVENALGRVTESLPLNSAAALRFSAADLDYWSDALAGPMKPESTRVWYRVSGAGAWQPLAVAFQGSDTGSFGTLGRVPAGDLYRADLTSATASAGAIDLRIEIEDARGNRASWTQSPAFVVTAPKRRSVR